MPPGESTHTRSAATVVVSTDRPEWRMRAVDQHLVSFLDPTSYEADQYRALRLVIEQIHSHRKTIAVTSAVAGDGKTTTALNLAGALAHAPDTRILVADFDLRTPSVGARLGLTAQSPGLVDLILDQDLVPDDVVQWHPQFRLAVLPAGRPLAVTYELLKSPRLAAILQDARRQYDYVVLDTPPLVPVPDSRLIADHVDGFVMVVAAHRTPRLLFQDALKLVDPAKLIGLVFNGDDRPRSRYYYGYYYGYGRRQARESRMADKIRRFLSRRRGPRSGRSHD